MQNVYLPTMVEGVNLDEFLVALKADKVDYGGRFVRKLKYIANQNVLS